MDKKEVVEYEKFTNEIISYVEDETYTEYTGWFSSVEKVRQVAKERFETKQEVIERVVAWSNKNNYEILSIVPMNTYQITTPYSYFDKPEWYEIYNAEIKIDKLTLYVIYKYHSIQSSKQ